MIAEAAWFLLLEAFWNDQLVATGYNAFYVTELTEHQCVLRQVWIRFAGTVITSLNKWDELPEILVLLRCCLNIGQRDAWGAVSVIML